MPISQTQMDQLPTPSQIAESLQADQSLLDLLMNKALGAHLQTQAIDQMEFTRMAQKTSKHRRQVLARDRRNLGKILDKLAQAHNSGLVEDKIQLSGMLPAEMQSALLPGASSTTPIAAASGGALSTSLAVATVVNECKWNGPGTYIYGWCVPPNLIPGRADLVFALYSGIIVVESDYNFFTQINKTPYYGPFGSGTPAQTVLAKYPGGVLVYNAPRPNDPSRFDLTAYLYTYWPLPCPQPPSCQTVTPIPPSPEPIPPPSIPPPEPIPEPLPEEPPLPPPTGPAPDTCPPPVINLSCPACACPLPPPPAPCPACPACNCSLGSFSVIQSQQQQQWIQGIDRILQTINLPAPLVQVLLDIKDTVNVTAPPLLAAPAVLPPGQPQPAELQKCPDTAELFADGTWRVKINTRDYPLLRDAICNTLVDLDEDWHAEDVESDDVGSEPVGSDFVPDGFDNLIPVFDTSKRT